jgi:uncharacterized membrane protein
MDLLLSLGRKGWFAFWVMLAGGAVAYVLTRDEPLGVHHFLVLLITVVPFLFLAFSARFLFTGEWRRPREKLSGD